MRIHTVDISRRTALPWILHQVCDALFPVYIDSFIMVGIVGRRFGFQQRVCWPSHQRPDFRTRHKAGLTDRRPNVNVSAIWANCKRGHATPQALLIFLTAWQFWIELTYSFIMVNFLPFKPFLGEKERIIILTAQILALNRRETHGYPSSNADINQPSCRRH